MHKSEKKKKNSHGLFNKVIETQLPRTYHNQTTKDKNTMLVTTIADAGGFAKCIVYDISKFPVF